ncbi:MAG: replication protein RepA [Salinisphaeraceae bacterium]
MRRISPGHKSGSMPRVLMSWITTEAVITGERDLYLGRSLSAFMRRLGYKGRSGGRGGQQAQFKDQAQRLLSSSFSVQWQTKDKIGTGHASMLVADRAELWWDPVNPEQDSLFESTVRLSETFREHILNGPVPLDMRALSVLKRSPMALDAYCWLSHRMFYLKTRAHIPWVSLQNQFGAGYPKTPEGTRSFKKAFIAQLKRVKTIYPEAKVEPTSEYLILRPSPPHVPHVSITKAIKGGNR